MERNRYRKRSSNRAISSITVTGALSDNGGVLSIDTATFGGAVTFTGNLSHTGGLTVGNATTLSGLKTYSGDTIVAGHSSGTSLLRYTSANAISVNSNVVIGDASTVGLVQFGYSPAAITLGTGGGQFRFNGDGGFLSSAVSAVDVTLTLNGGAGLAWGAGNFIGDGDTLYLGTDRSQCRRQRIESHEQHRSWSAAADRLRIQGNITDHGVMSGIAFRHRRLAGRRRRPARTQGNEHLYRRDRGAEHADARQRGRDHRWHRRCRRAIEPAAQRHRR